MKIKTRRGASALALLIGLSGFSVAAAQQAAPQTGPDTVPAAEDCDPERPGVQTGTACVTDRVVVTGSNIAGAVESAALPVEVYTADDSFKQGGQTSLEFIKTLSVVGSTIGESNQFILGTTSVGASTLNLRGLGGGRTLTIFNGRRFSDNTSMIPSIALERTEILKDGGAVIYGADATGGVVNFITRDNFDGVIAEAEYKIVDGSDGDYNAGLLYGKNFESANLMLSAEFSHRSEMPVTARDWAVRPYTENPTAFAPYHNYEVYQMVGATGAAVNVNPVFGSFVQDFSTSDCASSSGPVPGVVVPLGGLPQCWWNYPIHTLNLVEATDQMRLYGQFSADLDDSTRLFASLSYGKSTANDIGVVAAYQSNGGPAATTGGTFQYRTPVTNPYFSTFLAQNASQFTLGNVGSVAAADQFLTIMFGPSGSPAWAKGEGETPTTQLENWNAAASIDGHWGNWAGGWLDTWKLSMTYNLGTTDATVPDMLGFKVQQALNGFGGPNCAAPDLVPDNWNGITEAQFDVTGDGRALTTAEVAAMKQAFYATFGTQNPGEAGKNGCLWLNPFASSYAANGSFGQANPRYVAGNEVSKELASWLYDERHTEDQNNSLIIDALTSGVTPLKLPGGDVAYAVGAQWRQSENRESSDSPYIDPDTMPCPWPGQRPGNIGCPIAESPYFFWGSDDQTRTDQQQYSYFGELQVPVLDNLGFQLAVRREEFPRPGLGATVYKVAGKWDPFSWLAIRGSVGTNYATPPNNIVPGSINTGLSLITNAGNRYMRVETEVLPGTKPETADVFNVGAIFNFADLPLDGAFRLSVDYFNFEIKDEIKTVSHNAVLNSTFAATPGSTTLINCSAALIEKITFVNGTGAAGCTQGTTTGNDVIGVRSVFGNGPGAETSGVDIDGNYSFAALGGDWIAGLQATNVLSYSVAAFELDGVTLSPAVDALGFANYSRDGDLVSEWRGSGYLNYAIGPHNFRFVTRYISGVEDDRTSTPAQYKQIDDFITFHAYYQFTTPWDENMTLSLSVDNITDEDPPFVQQQYSYDPFIGNPLGRTFEIGLRKQF